MELPIDQLHLQFDRQQLWLLNLALSLVMFGIALEIRLADFREVFRAPKSVLAGVCAQFLLLPALTFVLVWAIAPRPSFALGMLLVASCPGGNVSNFMSHLARGNTALSVTLTAVATLMAVGMTPLNFQFWGSLYPPAGELLQTVRIEGWEMVRLVGLLLGLPVILGMALGHWRPDWARRTARIFKKASLAFFAILVLLALWKDRSVFESYVGYVFGIVLIHNLLALGTGYGLARALRLPGPDTRTLALETGIQNSGLGLLLIFTFFGGLGGMALIAAFWGIWHLISGMLVASLWSGLPLKKEQTI